MTNLEKIRIARDTFSECVEDAGTIKNMAILCFANFPAGEDSVESTGIVAGGNRDITIMLLTAMCKNKAIRNAILDAALNFPRFDRDHGEMIRSK